MMRFWEDFWTVYFKTTFYQRNNRYDGLVHSNCENVSAEITLQSYALPKQDSVHVCCLGLEAQINISNPSEQKKGL